MNNQNKSKKKLSFLNRRQFRYGGYAAVLTAIVIAVVILINIAVGMVEDNWALSIDVTAVNVTDFSEETKNIVADLDEEVHVYTLYQTATSNSLRVQVDEVLNKYRSMNRNIVVNNIDPVTDPARTKQLAGDANLSEGSVVVTNADESRVRLINRTDYYYNYTSQYVNQAFTVFDLEAKVTGALLYVTSDTTPRVFFLSGHDELNADSYMTLLTRQLQNENYDVSTLNLTTDTDVTLAAGDTIVIVNPQRDLSDSEYETVRTWLETGGRMLFALDSQTDTEVLSNFTKLLDYYQLSFGEGMVRENNDSTANWYGDLYTLVPTMDEENTITADLVSNGQRLMLPYCRPINPVAMPESGLQFSTLLTTSDKAIVQVGDEESLPGTQTLAMTMLKQDADDAQKDVRIALVGSMYTLADTQLMNFAYNMNFTMNLFNWLVNRDVSVSISSKALWGNTMSIPDSTTAWTLAGLVIVVIPLIVLIVGVVVWIRRRRL